MSEMIMSIIRFHANRRFNCIDALGFCMASNAIAREEWASAATLYFGFLAVSIVAETITKITNPTNSAPPPR